VSGRRKLTLVTVMLLILAGCRGSPTATPDLAATEEALRRAAVATLTAQAPTVTPSLAPTPTATHTLVATAIATESPTPTVTPERTPTPTDTPTAPMDTIYTVVNVASDDVLNVRAGPGVGNVIVGSIPPYGMDIQVVGAGEEIDSAVWVPIRYQDVAGWVNSNYLARQVGSVDEDVAARAAEIIMALEYEDLETLATAVHPEKGVRFSPYTYVRGEDLTFGAAQIRGLFADQTVYTWGVFDGTGEPIEFTFRAYFDRFIYDVDFARPDVVGLNETIGAGNTINNIVEAYPGAIAIEYHFEGFDPQYAGMDWRSLRLVLEKSEGVWYLVGVVHDEWTI
jgi:hypothetical protein